MAISRSNIGFEISKSPRKRKKKKQSYARGGKVPRVLNEFKAGTLRSGSPKGPTVTSPKQAVAIALSEERKRKKKKSKKKRK